VLFNIEFDHGDALEGYVIPDGFSEIANLRVSDLNGEIGVFPCDQLRQAVVTAGRHQSGMVGYRLDGSKVPNIAECSTLTIHDAQSGLLIYRRPKVVAPIQKKVIRLETQLLPLTRFDRYCGNYFHHELFSAERFGHETTLQVFHIDFTESIYVSGRLLMRNYEDFLGKGFEGIVLLADPYYEMALRLFLFKRMASTRINFLGERDKLILGPAIEYFAEANLDDAGALRALVKKAPLKVSNVLASPVARQFACSSPDQRVSRGEIAAAIDMLSRFTIVGHHADLPSFRDAVGEFLGIEADDLVIPPRQMLIEEIATKLKSVPTAEVLLEEDLIFDYYVRQALIPIDREDTTKDLKTHAVPPNR